MARKTEDLTSERTGTPSVIHERVPVYQSLSLYDTSTVYDAIVGLDLVPHLINAMATKDPVKLGKIECKVACFLAKRTVNNITDPSGLQFTNENLDARQMSAVNETPSKQVIPHIKPNRMETFTTISPLPDRDLESHTLNRDVLCNSFDSKSNDERSGTEPPTPLVLDPSFWQWYNENKGNL